MELNEIIHDLASTALTDPSQFIVDVIFSGKNAPSKKVLVIVDGDKGVNIDDCATISRTLSTKMDERNLISDKYMLEVSTPGLDHPLKLTRQYKKNVGRNIKVHLKDKSILQGKLVAADEEKISLDQEVKEGKKVSYKNIELAYGQIEKTFVLVSFK